MKTPLLVAWVALIGADRLDLAGGSLGVVLTPFLVLTPLLLVAQAADRRRTGRPLEIPDAGMRFTAVMLALLVVIGVSVFRSLDPESSASRAVLLIIQSFGTLAVAVHVVSDEESRHAVRRGAALGIILFAVVNVLAAAQWVGMLPLEMPLAFASLRLESYPYAGIFPRLSGTVIDPNRAALVLVTYMVLTRRFRWFAGVLLVLTLSRSGALAAGGVALVYLLRHGVSGIRIAPWQATATIALVAGSVIAIASTPTAMESASSVARTMTERFNFERGEGSAGDHVALLGRAVDEGTRSFDRAVTGLGYGASHVVLQDFFPGNRYGNFHSLYLSLFAEAGIFAMLLVLYLHLVPLVVPNEWQGLVLGAALFNVFYQAAAEPVFWLILSMAWLTLRPRRVPVVRHASLA